MSKNYLALSMGAIAVLCAGIGIGSTIKNCSNKMAVVDVSAIVSKSTQVQDLRNDVATKTQELTEWIQKARDEVKAEGNKEKQEALLKKYDAEFAQKREEISKDYNEKLQAVDKEINSIIAETAEKKGYKSVIAKSVMVYGGDDITEEVIKVIQ